MIGKLLDHRYQVIEVLATGGFGQTYIAQDTRRQVIPFALLSILNLLVQILKFLKQPNACLIVKRKL